MHRAAFLRSGLDYPVRMPLDWSTLNPDVIAEFRANGGQVERFGDQELVVLHTIGPRTGKVREVPLIVVSHGGEKLLFGTNAGSPKAPAWIHALRAQPRITVELGRERFDAEILEFSEAEAARIREQMAEASEPFRAYLASAAPRVVPVFRIVRR